MALPEVTTRSQALLTLGALVVLTSSVGAASLHASSLRAKRSAIAPEMERVTALLPGPDLVLAGGARHLRSLSQAEPSAAFSDGPGAIDDDPVGGLISPPREAWADEALRAR